MHTFKTASFFWSSSRPSSPIHSTGTASPPDSSVGLDVLNRPSYKPLKALALNPRRRSSAPPTSTTTTLVQDGSYLEALSLKLSEAVSEALSLPMGVPATGESLLNRKLALPRGRGYSFGTLIMSELEASASNPHLHKAIIRTLHRPLSVLLTNISDRIFTVTSSPQYLTPSSPSTLSTPRLHVIAYAVFAAELLEVIDEHRLGKGNDHMIGTATENLRCVLEGFESIIARVLNPLAQALKNELIPLIMALEHVPPPTLSLQTQVKGFQAKGIKTSLHPSIVTLQRITPLHAQNLFSYFSPPTMTSQTTLATVLISLIWHSLVALSHRPCASSIPGSSQSATLTQSPSRKVRIPPTMPPSMLFSIKLPPSRPSTPPEVLVPPAAADAHALFDVFSILPLPDKSMRFALARDAVDEAFGGLKALCALLDAEANGQFTDIDVITVNLPTVIALPVLLRVFDGRAPKESGSNVSLSVPSLLQLSDEEYRATCLSGFGKAQECGPLVARRVLEALLEQQDTKWDGLIQWLEDRMNLID